jgi:hypothetical protein
MRSGRWNQVVKADFFDAARCRATRCLVCHSLFLYRRHYDEMTHVFDLSAQRG